MKLALSTLLLILSTFAASAEKARYDNYRVYNVPIENQLQLRALKELSVVSDSVKSIEITVCSVAQLI